MRLDLDKLELVDSPYSQEPMSFLRPKDARDLMDVIELHIIENGPRKARENWQQTQLRNLIDFSISRSEFWRARFGGRKSWGKSDKLSSLPILSRSDLRRQFDSEGSLIGAADRLPIMEATTSGSSGIPVKFFATGMNKRFTDVWSFLGTLTESGEPTYNITRLNDIGGAQDGPLFKVDQQISENLLQATFIKQKRFKQISFAATEIDKVIRELGRDKIGRLITFPWNIELLLQKVGAEFLKRNGCKSVVLLGGNINPDCFDELKAQNIFVRSTYSCREAGPIGLSCNEFPMFYHVQGSNVIVEVEKDTVAHDGGKALGRVLLTALHSYATPLIRYDVGDLAYLHNRCPCGHDGPTLGNVLGRTKNFFRKADGSLRLFVGRVREYPWLMQYSEFRFVQTDFDRLRIEVGGTERLSDSQQQQFRALVDADFGKDVETEIVCCDRIDWGPGGKKLMFRSEVD